STWIPSSLVPDVNALTIEIRATHTVTIKTPASTRSAVVKGTLKLLNGNSNTGSLTLYTPNRFILYSLKVADGGLFQVVSEDAFYSETIQFHDEDAAITVYGKIMIGDGGSQNSDGYYGFATAPNQRVYWYNNSVFEWNNNNSAHIPAGDTTYFPNAAGHPIFRITNIGGTISGLTNTIINGFLEVNTPVNFDGAGIKTIADGIRGNSGITQADGSGLLRISSPTTEVFAEGLNTQDIEIGLLSGNIQLNLNSTGLIFENGIAVSEDANVQINGPCLSKGKFAVRTNATLTAATATLVNMENADLVNEGLVQGAGTIQFSGAVMSTLSSPGTISAPVKLVHKQLQLGSNSNINNLELTDTSNLWLAAYDLQLGSAALLADSVNFIVTNDTGTLIRTVDINEVIFPVGISSTSYTPAYITNNISASNIDVRVKQAVLDGAGVPVTEGNADRSWLVGSNDPASNINLKLEWDDATAQPQFERDYSYISLFTECQSAPNCTGGYYDASTPQQAIGSIRFTQTRTGFDVFTGRTCIVTSKPFVYTFTGNGDWNDAMNWTPGLVPSPTVKPGIQVVIDPIVGGQCIFTGDITVQPGGNITVKQGKSFEIIGNIILP
ncbi:MAG TPA: hypothetical protein PLC48_13705, partial [Ferruginibacter sp.]|nr:hypothetical protein [Ferruginibacter sp.]